MKRAFEVKSKTFLLVLQVLSLDMQNKLAKM